MMVKKNKSEAYEDKYRRRCLSSELRELGIVWGELVDQISANGQMQQLRKIAVIYWESCTQASALLRRKDEIHIDRNSPTP